jgi:hypothetical protein
MSEKVTIERKKEVRHILKFLKYHRTQPEVYDYFKKFMFEMIESGSTKISGRLCFERVRWEMEVVKLEDFKMNNDYVPAFNRLFICENPHYKDMVKLRKSIFDEYEFKKLVKQ